MDGTRCLIDGARWSAGRETVITARHSSLGMDQENELILILCASRTRRSGARPHMDYLTPIPPHLFLEVPPVTQA